MERGYLRETNIFSKLRNLAREKRHHNIIKALPVSTEQQLEVEVAEGDSMCQRGRVIYNNKAYRGSGRTTGASRYGLNQDQTEPNYEAIESTYNVPTS